MEYAFLLYYNVFYNLSNFLRSFRFIKDKTVDQLGRKLQIRRPNLQDDDFRFTPPFYFFDPPCNGNFRIELHDKIFLKTLAEVLNSLET